MKQILNNQDNVLLFITDGVDYSDATIVRLRQLGGEGNTDVPVIDVYSDCLTCSITINLPADTLSNGTYLLTLLDSFNETLAVTTAHIDNYDSDSPRAYIVTDDSVDEDQVILN